MDSLYPVLRLFLTLLIVLAFVWGLTVLVDYKLHRLLDSLSKTIKLEFRDPIGRICLAGVILFISLFFVCFISDEAFRIASSFLQPELVQHSINLNMLAVIIALTFVVNLVILGLLAAQRSKS